MTGSIWPRVIFAMVVLSTAVLQYRLAAHLADRQDAMRGLDRGSAAPELEAARPDGSALRLTDLGDRVAIVSFWTTWCLPCRVEMPELAEFVDTWNADPSSTKEVVFVAVNVKEQPGDVAAFTTDPVFGDVVFALDPEGEVAERWKVYGFPSTFVVGPDGTVLDAVVGYDPKLAFRIRGVLKPFRAAGSQ